MTAIWRGRRARSSFSRSRDSSAVTGPSLRRAEGESRKLERDEDIVSNPVNPLYAAKLTQGLGGGATGVVGKVMAYDHRYEKRNWKGEISGGIKLLLPGNSRTQTGGSVPQDTGRRSASGGAVEGLEDQDEGQDDHKDGGDPGNDVEDEGVGVFAHEIFAVDEEQNEDDDDGEPDAVADLREDEDFPEWGVGEKDDAAADDDEDGVEPVEGGGFAEFVIDASFEAQAFADDVSGGERKDGGGKERGIEKAEGKGEAGPLPCQWDEGFGGFGSIGDVGQAGGVQRGSGANDDEENDDHATDAAEQDIEAGLRVLARANFLFDEARLQIEKLPRGDGGADESGKSDEITEIKWILGDDGHAGSLNQSGWERSAEKR